MSSSFKDRANRVTEICDDKKEYLEKAKDMELNDLRYDLTCLSTYINGNVERYADTASEIRQEIIELIKIKANIL